VVKGGGEWLRAVTDQGRWWCKMVFKRGRERVREMVREGERDSESEWGLGG